MPKTTKPRTYPCHRCGCSRLRDQLLRTRDGNYYCRVWGPCDRRYHKKQKESV